MTRARAQRITRVPAIALMLVVSGGFARIDDSAAMSDGSVQFHSAIGTTAPGHYIVETAGTSLESLLNHLSVQAGFEWIDRAGIPDDERISGSFQGPLDEVAARILHRYNIAISRRGDGSIERLVILSRMPRNSVAQIAGNSPAYQTERQAVLSSERQYLQWLDGFAGDAPEPANRTGVVDITGVPAMLADQMTNQLVSQDDGSGTSGLENVSGGSPPAHLSGANDAAQVEIEEALRRTTHIAVSSVEHVSNALEALCAEDQCTE